MNTKSSPLLIVLHYVGLLVLALFTFVGLSFLSGNVITGIVGAILLATLVEIVTANLRKRKIQSAQSYNSSTMLPILWGVYALLFLLSAPILLHGFSVGVVERGKIEDACNFEMKRLETSSRIIDDILSREEKVVSTIAKTDAKAGQLADNRLEPLRDAKMKLENLQSVQGRQLEKTTLNPFNFLFFFKRDLNDYDITLKDVEEACQKTGFIDVKEVFGEKTYLGEIDMSKFDTRRIAWGVSLVFLIIVHILILWQVYNISVSGPGKIRGGNSAPGVHTFGR